MFKKKKSLEEKRKKSLRNKSELIDKFDILIVMAKEDAHKEKLKMIKDELIFSLTGFKYDTYTNDKKIMNLLEDLRILLSSKKPDIPKIDNNLKDLELLVVIRNQNL